ncbi:hypothetical protein Tco_0812654 [Tanacetum coccineum]
MMVHGPCGLVDADTVCMKEGRCSKKFPKKYNNNTLFGKAEYVHYRRKETEVYATRWGVELDNNYTVPYNRTDRIMAQVTRLVGEPPTVIERTQIQIDEIKNFVDGRILLFHQKGCQTFDDIRIVNRTLFSTFRAACEALSLLSNDQEWDIALEEASFASTPNGYSNTLKDFGLPLLSRRLLEELGNKELMEEKGYNRLELTKEVATLIPKLNVYQKKIYDLIIPVATAADKHALDNIKYLIRRIRAVEQETRKLDMETSK